MEYTVLGLTSHATCSYEVFCGFRNSCYVWPSDHCKNFGSAPSMSIVPSDIKVVGTETAVFPWTHHLTAFMSVVGKGGTMRCLDQSSVKLGAANFCVAIFGHHRQRQESICAAQKWQKVLLDGRWQSKTTSQRTSWFGFKFWSKTGRVDYPCWRRRHVHCVNTSQPPRYLI